MLDLYHPSTLQKSAAIVYSGLEVRQHKSPTNCRALPPGRARLTPHPDLFAAIFAWFAILFTGRYPPFSLQP
jgi:hypothetical protein